MPRKTPPIGSGAQVWRSPCASPEQCRSEPVWIDPPVVVLLAVDEGDRDLLPVPLMEIGTIRYVDLRPFRTGFIAHSGNHGASVVAEVTSGLAQQCDAPTHDHRH
jgi:hypothetical protein